MLSRVHQVTAYLFQCSCLTHCQEFIWSPPIYFSIYVLALPIPLALLLTLTRSCLLSPFSASITVCSPSRVHTVKGSLGHHLFILAFMSFGSHSLYLALSLPIPQPLLLTHPPHLPSFHPICPLPRVCQVISCISGFSLQGMQIFEYFPLLYMLTVILHLTHSPTLSHPHHQSPPPSCFPLPLPPPFSLPHPLCPLPLTPPACSLTLHVTDAQFLACIRTNS